MTTTKTTKTTKTTAAAAVVVIAKPNKAEAAYVNGLAEKLAGFDSSSKALMLEVHGLAEKCGKRAADLATFAFEQAYGADVPRQRLSQVRQFIALPSAQRAELCKHYGSIGLAAIKRNTVSAKGVYTAPVKAKKVPRVGGAKDAAGTPLSAAPATVLAAVATMLARIEAGKLTKPQQAVLAGLISDCGEFADMLK